MGGALGRDLYSRENAGQGLPKLLRPPGGGLPLHGQGVSLPPERALCARSDAGGGFCRSAIARHIPGSVQRSCSRSCGKSRTLCTALTSPRRLAGEPQTAVFHPSPNTPSMAYSHPPRREKVLPMCPVRCVTYVQAAQSGSPLCASNSLYGAKE